MAPRGWYRSHFKDHPLYRTNQRQARPDEVWANIAKDKVKIICTPCLDYRVSVIQREEEQRFAADPQLLPRDREAIILSREQNPCLVNWHKLIIYSY